MWNPAGILDRKAYLGMSAAALIGLLAGAAMKPVLKVGDGPEGPQLLMPVSPHRAPYADDRLAFVAYPFGLPDFVIGTDWLQPFETYDEPPPVSQEPPAEDYAYVAYEPPPPPPAREEVAPPPPSYPSLGGDILAGVAQPPPADEATPPQPEPAETAVLLKPAA
jgi:hypothetical protein